MPAQGTKKSSEQQDPYSNDPKHDNPPSERKGGHQDHQTSPESQKGLPNKQGHPGSKPDRGRPNSTKN
jgi:hypothetical protein